MNLLLYMVTYLRDSLEAHVELKKDIYLKLLIFNTFPDEPEVTSALFFLIRNP